MAIKARTFLLIIPFAQLISCVPENSGIRPNDYVPLLQDLHAIECKHLVEAGKSTRYPDAYAFRSAAFQEILRDLDRTVLAEYESYYQQLADLEFRMSESEKQAYYKATEDLYKGECR